MKTDMKRKPRRPLAIDRIEALESRALMTGLVQGGWPGPHTLPLTLENGSVSASPSQELTINAAQFAAGGNKAIFSGAIIGPPGQTFHGVSAELRFRNNAAGPITSVTTFSPEEPSPIAGRVQVRFSNATLALNANAINLVRVAALRAGFPTANAFSTFPAGDLRILVDTIGPTVDQVGPIDSPRDTAVSTVTVTTSDPVQLGEFTFADLTLTKDGVPVALNGTVTVADGGTANRYIISGLGPFTNTAGTYVLTVNGAGLFDAVGNPGTNAGSASFTFDPNLNVLPAPPPPDLQAASDTGFSQTDNITSATSVTFDVTAMNASTTIQLLRDGTVVGSRVGPGSIAVANAPQGVHAYTARQVDAAARLGLQSVALSVVVDVTAPAVSVALDRSQVTFSGATDPYTATTVRRPSLIVTATDLPSNPNNVRFAEISSIDERLPSVPTAAPPALAGETIAPLTVPSDLAPGTHTVKVLVRDSAGNPTLTSFTFTVLANPALATPGTPVYSTIFDINAVEKALNAAQGSSVVSDDERPWSMAFDRTTQTVFAVVRGNDIGPINTGGNRLIQLDPANGRLRAWNLEGLDKNSGPHGDFFDFETHNTPRIWFTQRTGDQAADTHAGRLSYLDLTTNEIVSYDIRGMLRTQFPSLNLKGDLHAVVSDRRGVVWVSDEADGLILELDFRKGPDGLSSKTGTMVVHAVPNTAPKDLTGSLIQGENVAGPHGIDVVIDDRDGSALVYYTSIIEGRFNVLKPAEPDRPIGDPVRQVKDLWYSWNINQLVLDEFNQGLAPGDPKLATVAIGAPLFPTVDNHETPGRPEDDFIYFGDPGFPNATLPNGKRADNNVVRRLEPGDLRSAPAVVTSPITTWHLPGVDATSKAAINQTFVDRDGTVFYIDRQGSVGRLDPTSAPGAIAGSSTTFMAKAIRNDQPTMSGKLTLTPVVRPPGEKVSFVETILPRVTVADPTKVGSDDRATIGGLDQYLVRTTTGSLAPGQGNGPFRGTLSAGEIVFTSLTQGDQISSTLFAEEARRETSIVVAPDGSRKVFQTRRDGVVVLTERNAGSIVDRQRVLTRPGLDPAIQGDVAAVVDAAGVVSVFGRDDFGGLAEYRYNPVTKGWTSRILGHAKTNLAGDPQAYIDPIRGAAALATTTDGHLVAFFADNGQVVDLTDKAGAGAAGVVYSKTGVVVSGRLTFAYGTNQKGDLLEYVIQPGATAAAVRKVPLPAGNRDLMLFQDLEAVEINGTRHVFGSDGSSRLVHVTIQPNGTASAENVTELTKDLASGYSAYQQPFAARVYGGANPVVTTDGQIFVYGTNGRDLVEFQRTTDGKWSAADLTNRPANRVFGNPSAFLAPNGDRHVLLINEDGEMIEYYKLHGLDFATVNLTLTQGNSTTNIPPLYPNTLPGTPAAPGSIPADDFANLPGFAAAPLALNTGSPATISGRIGVAGDHDVFRFVATRTGMVAVDLKNTGGGGLNPVIEALTAAKKRIARSDHASRGSVDSRVTSHVVAGQTYYSIDSRVTFHVVAGQTYYLVASGKFRQTGAYTLSAHFTDVAIMGRRARVATVGGETSAIVTRYGRPWAKARSSRA